MLIDPRGLAVTASNAASVALLETTIMGYAGFKIDTGDRLKAALSADPGMVMAHLLRGYFMMLLMKRELVARADESAAAAERAMYGAARPAANATIWMRCALGFAATARRRSRA